MCFWSRCRPTRTGLMEGIETEQVYVDLRDCKEDEEYTEAKSQGQPSVLLLIFK